MPFNLFTSIPVSELFSVLDEEVEFLNSSNQEKSIWMLYSKEIPTIVT